MDWELEGPFYRPYVMSIYWVPFIGCLFHEEHVVQWVADGQFLTTLHQCGQRALLCSYEGYLPFLWVEKVVGKVSLHVLDDLEEQASR